MKSGFTTLSAVLRQRSGAVGIVLVIVHLLIALLAPIIIPHDAVAQEAAAILEPPSLIRLFGTDRLGRDGLRRIGLGRAPASRAASAGVNREAGLPKWRWAAASATACR